MAHDVFISHSSKDKTTADAVCAMLESSGVRCWIAPRDVTPGREWGACIIEAIKECRVMVLVFTNHANESPQIRREVERAINHSVMILPLRIEDILPSTELEYFIGNLHWLDAITPPLETHLKSLAVTVKILLERMPAHDPQSFPAPIHPLSEALHRNEEGHKGRPANVVERKERALDAAMSRTVPVGRATQVLAMAREADSQGLRHILKIEEDYSVTPEDVRSRQIEIEFPVDSHGNPQPAEFNLRLEAPDFEPRSQTKRLLIPVSGDSEICTFLVTAQRAGELLLNLEVLARESSIATRTFKTMARANAPADVSVADSVLVSVPLYTSASTWSAPRFSSSDVSSGYEHASSVEAVYSHTRAPLPPSAKSSSTSASDVPMAAPPAPSKKSSTRKLVSLSAIFALTLFAVGSFTYQKWRDASSGGEAKMPAALPLTTSVQSTGSQIATPDSDATQAPDATNQYFPDSPQEVSRLSFFDTPDTDAKFVSAREASCDAGKPAGCADLAYIYDLGLGVTQDETRAFSLYQKACDGGDAAGCTNLGYMYAEGEGVAKDEARAVPLYQKGCDGGEVFACYNLAYAYGRGRGVPIDGKRALTFMQKACTLGNSYSCDQVKKIYGN